MNSYRLILAAGLMSVSTLTFAQKGVEDGSKFGHGADSVRCIDNYVRYGDAVKMKDFKEAYEPWKVVFEECPLAKGVTLYSDGVKIAKSLMQTDKANKDTYYDLLLKVYDQRMKYFGKNKKYPTSYLKGMKALDMLQYKTDNATRKAAVALLNDAIVGDPATVQGAFLQTLMLQVVNQFKDDEVSSEDVVNTYVKCTEIAVKAEAAAQDKAKESVAQAKEQVEQIFAQSGAADCEILAKIFTPQLEANKNNTDWLKKVNRLLGNSDCAETDLAFHISESLHKLDPDASSARGLAKHLIKEGKTTEAFSYYEEAIKLETEDKMKAKYYYEMGLINYASQKYAEAKAAAYNAIKLRGDWGDPYLLLAKVYAQGARNIGEKDYEKRAGYWAAVDKAAKAKAVDQSESVQKEAAELIRQYSQHFPSKEDLFFEGLKDGSAYKVGGFINESTTVRAKK